MKVSRLKKLLELFEDDLTITVIELGSDAYYLKIDDCAIIIENNFEKLE